MLVEDFFLPGQNWGMTKVSLISQIEVQTRSTTPVSIKHEVIAQPIKDIANC